MEDLVIRVIEVVVPALVGGLVALVLARFRLQKALDAALAAKKACNEEVHYLQNQISCLRSALFVAEARIVALEHEFDKRLKAVESPNAG